jgi:SET domain-containing protein
MLLVRAEVRPSPIHGLGVFAAEPVAAGTPVSGWHAAKDFKLTPREWDALPKNLRNYLYTFMWIGPDACWYGSHDGARFTNHSETPNLRWDETTRVSVAARDIAAGEEFTENYEEFDHAFEDYAEELAK